MASSHSNPNRSLIASSYSKKDTRPVPVDAEIGRVFLVLLVSAPT